MQCACAILSSVACTVLHFFSTLSHKLHDFLKRKAIDIKWCFDFLYKRLSEIFLILRRIERDMIKKKYIGLHVKFLFFLSYFDGT